MRFSEVAVSSGKVTAEQLSLALAVRTKFSLLDMSNSTLGRELVAAFDVNHPFMDDLRMLRMRIKARLAGRRTRIACRSRGEPWRQGRQVVLGCQSRR